MFARPDLQSRLILACCAFAAEVLHLGWEVTHGGVPAHHLLNNPELPAISNWWGLLVVPLLVWFLVGRIQRRAATLVQTGSRERFRTRAQARFAVAFLWAGLLALAFTFGHPAVTWIFFGAFAAAMLAGAWRAEYVLGFALGMTFTFGAVLPVLVASVIAACAFTVHLLIGAALRLARGGRARGVGLPQTDPPVHSGTEQLGPSRMAHPYLAWISTETLCLSVWQLLFSRMAQNVQHDHPCKV